MRLIALTALIACLALPAQAEDLRSAFYALPKGDRIAIQAKLSDAGLYHGALDGLWGPGTANALARAEESLAWDSYAATAAAAGVTSQPAVLWSYVSDPDLRASLPGHR